jgi:hypothetical protein
MSNVNKKKGVILRLHLIKNAKPMWGFIQWALLFNINPKP